MAATWAAKRPLRDGDGRQPLGDLVERGFALQIAERHEERRETYDAPQDPGSPGGEKSQQDAAIRKLGAIGYDRDDQQFPGKKNCQREQAEENAKSLEVDWKGGQRSRARQGKLTRAGERSGKMVCLKENHGRNKRVASVTYSGIYFLRRPRITSTAPEISAIALPAEAGLISGTAS